MKEFLQKISSKIGKLPVKNILYVKSGIEPRKNWGMMVGLGVLAVCVIAILSYFLHSRIEKGTLFTAEPGDTHTSISINLSLLKKVVEHIHTKKVKMENAANQPPSPDPSF
jgi:hypothetical protein